jgi:hypothetical protein
MRFRDGLKTPQHFEEFLMQLVERPLDREDVQGFTFMGPSAPSCALAPEKLRAYVDGTLPEEDLPELMDAIIECEDCAQKLAEMMGERIGSTAR